MKLKFLALFLGLLPAAAFELPADTTQCVLGLADSWDHSTATLRFFEKSGTTWKATGEPWQARLGKSGLVWGNGLHPIPAGAVTKREGDNRSPAGIFAIGAAWGYEATIRKQPNLPYHQVTSHDLWVEDPTSPNYNQHVVLNHEPATAWEKKQQMKQADPAHSLELFIHHNASPKAVPNSGSSIFFHIWRGGGSRPTAGCTTMEKPKLEWLIARINPARHPLYVLLPKSEYAKLRSPWKLPDAE